ncbi:Glutamine-rich protein 2 [Acropora cervicornis]|uniref:Glutamine-rich protein 2 n=1 Tax=Acropora cervicornis TaxID=6130 RepID=A0AAD9VDL1_ACRCE|nr:Glutamine-rich protein 2 [Acropora cervicornis]
MATHVELEQLLDIALTTPEIGTVNFNILRVFLHEILKHLQIEKKSIDVESLRSELQSAYDFITDGHVEIRSRSARSEATIENTPENTSPDTQGQESEVLSKPETPAQVGESSREPTAEESPMLSESSPTSTPQKPRSKLSSTKDRNTPARSSVVLIRKSDSLKNLKRRVSEIQERVEVLESQPLIQAPDSARSAASLLRKDSKTPAHDFVELVNIKRRLEAAENSIEGLTDMLDALTSDFNEFNESNLKSRDQNSITLAELEELKSSFKDLQDERVPERLLRNENAISRVDELESMINKLVDDVKYLKNQESTKENFEATIDENLDNRDLVESLHKQFQGMVAQIQEIQGIINETDARLCAAEQVASDALASVQVSFSQLTIPDIKDKLTELEKMVAEHKMMIEESETQIQQLKNTISLLQRASLERMHVEVEKQNEEEDTPAPRPHSYGREREELSLIRTMIFDLQEEKENLKKTDIRLNEELYKKQKHLDDIYNLIDELKDVKADKELLNIGFDMKADKREIDTKIGRHDFDHYMSLVDQSLRDLLQRLEGHEEALNSALLSLTSDVGKKFDKEDVEPLKDYLEARIQATKPKPVEKPSKEEFAAGIRRQFLVNHNCISCDRPVKYASEGMFPPLPALHSMPGSKSNRPYTTFELEQLRQHMLQGGLSVTKERFEVMDKQRNKLQNEMLRLSGARNIQELAEVTARACGGIHTLTYPHSPAIVRGLQLNRDDLDLLVPQKDFQSVDIQGQDGHIYKGLLDGLSPLPEIPQKRKSPRTSAAQRNLRRSTTPASDNNQKTSDQVNSA